MNRSIARILLTPLVHRGAWCATAGTRVFIASKELCKKRKTFSQYGSAIVREASRLAELLGQILEFAGMQARRVEVRRESVDIGVIVHDATDQCRWLAEQANVQMEVDIAPRPHDCSSRSSAVAPRHCAEPVLGSSTGCSG